MSVSDGTVSPTSVGGLVIGAVDHINGSGAEPSGFVVTKHELEQVARYWEEEYWRIAFKCFATQQTGSTECRIAQYSTERRAAIADVLGTERLDEIHHEVLAAFQARTDPTAWRLFTDYSHGDI